MPGRKRNGFVVEEQEREMVWLPLLLPPSAELERASDPQVTAMEADNVGAAMQDAPVPGPRTPARDGHDLPSGSDAVAGWGHQRHSPKSSSRLIGSSLPPTPNVRGQGRSCALDGTVSEDRSMKRVKAVQDGLRFRDSDIGWALEELWVAGGIEQEAIDALRHPAVDGATTEPADEICAEQVGVDLAASRRHLADILDRYWDRDWRSQQSRDFPPEDHLWRAAEASREIETALAGPS
jgi:hypothetical protein